MIDIKIHTMLEFKTSVHLTLRKQVTLAFEKRYDRQSFISGKAFVKVQCWMLKEYGNNSYMRT